MKLRPPATPLITVDPYFSIWSMADKLNGSTVRHWTGSPNTMIGTVTAGGKEYIFMGEAKGIEQIPQISCEVDALSTVYTFKNDAITLVAAFMTPLLPDDLDVMTRPVSYLEIKCITADGSPAQVKIAASEELCLNLKGEGSVVTEIVDFMGGSAVKMGNAEQKPLWRSGDNVRIDWGYFYLASAGVAKLSVCDMDEMIFAQLEKDVASGESALILFAYDDVESMEYFGAHLKSYWNREGACIKCALKAAVSQYEQLKVRAKEFADRLYADAKEAGGEKYADLLSLAWRQVIAAHKVVLDTDGELLFISKECFSNGCAATVDVSYPSIPMFLLYNPELVLGMMRPIFKYAASEAWPFDFAPHDAGQYPLVNGQVYNNVKIEGQMPVEECGNMLVMAAAASIALKDASFAAAHVDTLNGWAEYLIKYGVDPEHQLCTDDFAGHLAHNCNLSLKAISGLMGLSIIHEMLGNTGLQEKYETAARDIAAVWVKNAANGDGSYRLAFDRPDTFSMKYNAVWDKLFGTKIFDACVMGSEIASNFRHFNPYGMPLDNRATYTKSDWLVWTATLAADKETFERFIEPLWLAYHLSPSRVPMTDWYDTVTSIQRGFQHRTVQGGFFIKLLEWKGIMKVR
ncbi:MAG: DUF4965 domain-containing protein [Clostridia bacterium]|nr:DUF4965 domain-containing protein [Clostridia bacterium]